MKYAMQPAKSVTPVVTPQENCAASSGLNGVTLTANFNNKTWHEISTSLPKGDGHPVLIIPGFLTNDFYMSELQERIGAQGYKVYGWNDGFDLGASKKAADHLTARLEKIYTENNGQKISVIGYSLGGVYARELARKYPEMVRDVVTLSAPFGLQSAEGGADSRVAQIYQYINSDNGVQDSAAIYKTMVHPPPVPTTAVYSKNDMIVDWHTSANLVCTFNASNVEVTSGHLAMPFDKQTAAVTLKSIAPLRK